MSVGYSTLYGDSAGGFAVIKDVPKQLVYRLARHRDAARGRRRRARATCSRAHRPAELRPDQRERRLQLPPFVLDEILWGYVGADLSTAAARHHRHPGCRTSIASSGSSTLRDYERRQQHPGIKITERARTGATAACQSRTASAAEDCASRATATPRSSSASWRTGAPGRRDSTSQTPRRAATMAALRAPRGSSPRAIGRRTGLIRQAHRRIALQQYNDAQ